MNHNVYTTLSLIALLVVTATISSALLVSAAAESDPVLVFVHRHGARTPQGVVGTGTDQITTCEYPLCQLTEQGKAQCASVGKHMSANYIAKYTPGAEQRYSVKSMRTESTDTKRTVQSAESVLAGAYGDGTVPFVEFVPTDIDYNMSFWSSWPYWKMAKVRATRLAGYPTAYVEREFGAGTESTPGGKTLLEQFGTALNAEAICARSPIDCMILVADVLECNAANAVAIPQALRDHEAAIRKAKAVMFAKLLGFDPASSDCTEPGGFGYSFARELVEALAYVPRAGTDEWPLRVFQFSAHDWTLFPLYSALGLWTPDMMLDLDWIPRFADTLVLRTFWVTNSSGSRVQGIKAYRVYPAQKPAAGKSSESIAAFPIEVDEEVGLLCSAPADSDSSKNKKKRYSNETSGGCTFDELYRTIELVAPQTLPGGKCYATHGDMHESGCLADAAPEHGSSCQLYRQVCSHVPCGQVPSTASNYDQPGGFSKISDPAKQFACVETKPTQQGEYPVGLAATLVSIGFCVGGILGAVIVKIYFVKLAPHLEDDTTTAAALAGQKSVTNARSPLLENR